MLYPNAPVVSEITLYTLQDEPVGQPRVAGLPLITLSTYGQDRATFHLWASDGTPQDEVECPPAEVLGVVRALRRTAQDEPARFVCLNRTRYDDGYERLSLVA